MIVRAHAVIRTADPDDAVALKEYYSLARVRAANLDRKRELIEPTTDELEEILARKDKDAGTLYAVETVDGQVAGFCALRGVTREGGMAEVAMMFSDDRFYAGALAAEALDFLFDLAFNRQFLNKVAAHCLEDEVALRRLLVQTGFETEGRQRQAVYAKGRWHDLETLAFFRRNYQGM